MEQQTGSGENAVIQKVTWTRRQRADRGGLALPVPRAAGARPGTYTFQVQQTYSDGSIVDWSGPESADAPGADDRGEELARRRRHLDADDRRARRRRARRRSLGGFALVVGGGRRAARMTRRGRIAAVAVVAAGCARCCRRRRPRTPT